MVGGGLRPIEVLLVEDNPGGAHRESAAGAEGLHPVPRGDGL